jgi:hypothetical protein
MESYFVSATFRDQFILGHDQLNFEARLEAFGFKIDNLEKD